jgi:PleD family two-component response regulator
MTSTETILAEEDAIIKQGELQDEEPKHVLVVDDDKVSRKTLANFLKKLGFEGIKVSIWQNVYNL